jgi:hypothetical protein
MRNELTLAARTMLRRQEVSNDVVEALTQQQDSDLVAAANRFSEARGIGRVLAEAVSADENKRRGARFVLEYALEKVPATDSRVSRVAFEMHTGPRETER